MDDDSASADGHTRDPPAHESDEPPSTTRKSRVRRSLTLFPRKITTLDFAALIRTSSLRSSTAKSKAKRAQKRNSRRTMAVMEYNTDSKDATPDSEDDRVAMPQISTDVVPVPVLESKANRSTDSVEKEEEDDTGNDSGVVISDILLIRQLPRTPPSTSDSPHPSPSNVAALRQSSSTVRPLSTATTNTASTATPANVTPRKRPPSRIPIPSVREEPLDSMTKTPPATPRKNFHIFGIPLPSPRRGSFSSSRPATPSDAGASVSAPKRESSSSKPRFLIGTGLKVSSPKMTNAPKAATKPKAMPSPTKTPPRTTPGQQSPLTKSTSPKSVSSPTRSVSVSRPLSPKSPGSPKSSSPRAHISSAAVAADSIGKRNNRQYMSEVGARSPRIGLPTSPRGSLNIGTPGSLKHSSSTVGSPVAVRSALGVSTRASAGTLSSVSTRERKPSSDSSSQSHSQSHAHSNLNPHSPHHVHYRPAAHLSGIEEWRLETDEDALARIGITNVQARPKPLSVAARAVSEIGNHARAHVTIAKSSLATTTMTSAARTPSTVGSTAGRKHGSFDFERPGWSVGSATSSIGARSRKRPESEENIPMRRGAHISAKDQQNRSTSAGMAGVGSARFYASMAPPPPAEPEPTPRQRTDSWGKSPGKRLSAGLTKLFGNTGSNSKPSSVVGVNRQHAKFSFEPPVRLASPPSPEPVLERRPSPSPLSKRGHSASHSTSSTASSAPSVGHRSGTKPRSLDLGLGLAWAPTKLREDAVLPASPLGRSLSTSKRAEQGRAVAEQFRSALDEDGYRSFKRYVHRFDAHEIPFDGSTGIVTRVERLLKKARHLSDDERARMMDSFIRIILQAA
ncbi:unnamed protein product [Mycena citricolor]|uniref:Uncharacterized protein n=1 Tax=Mycena citricolor TaxID=2018698 RepID=A0AAD2GVD9_9AGAR|nr:unnamed protein product [Mycena citricolor]